MEAADSNKIVPQLWQKVLHYSSSEWVPATEADVAAEKEQFSYKNIANNSDSNRW